MNKLYEPKKLLITPFLAGSIPKGDKELASYVDWRAEYLRVIAKTVEIGPSIDPNIFYDLEGDSKGVFGADTYLLTQCTHMIVNATEKLGAGTSMELVIAKYYGIPVITVLPKDTHHRRSNLKFHERLVQDWVHPYIDIFSDVIIEDISEFADALKKLEGKEIKKMNVIDESVAYAKELIEKKSLL